MAEFLQTVEEIKAEEASISRVFDGEGRRLRDGHRSEKYMGKLVEASKFMGQILSGRRPLYHMQEAMSTSDFPILFADLMDRQLLAAYREVPQTNQILARSTTVPDFRPVHRVAVDGAESPLPEVDELEEYPEAALHETTDEFKVRKYGRRLDLSWEAQVNDDLDAFRRNPERLARAARRTEARFVTGLYVDASGPHASLYNNGFGNIIPGNPELNLASIQAAIQALGEMVDDDGEPIVFEYVYLVVPPALEVAAQNILNATQLQIGDTTDADVPVMTTTNWMKNRLQLVIDPYITHIASTANGRTSWFLFGDPNSGRSALEIGKLRGYEDPALFERAPNARRVGGGDAMEAFEDDSNAWKVRHVLGGGRLTNTGGAKSTVASNGAGS